MRIKECIKVNDILKNAIGKATTAKALRYKLYMKCNTEGDYASDNHFHRGFNMNTLRNVYLILHLRAVLSALHLFPNQKELEPITVETKQAAMTGEESMGDEELYSIAMKLEYSGTACEVINDDRHRDTIRSQGKLKKSHTF